ARGRGQAHPRRPCASGSDRASAPVCARRRGLPFPSLPGLLALPASEAKLVVADVDLGAVEADGFEPGPEGVGVDGYEGVVDVAGAHAVAVEGVDTDELTARPEHALHLGEEL